MTERIRISESEWERLADIRFMRAIQRDRLYKTASTPEQQARAEERIEREVNRALGEKFVIEYDDALLYVAFPARRV